MPFARWARRCWYFLNRRRLERDLEREMAQHRAMMPEPRRFGNSIRLREESADVWGWAWIDDLRQDLRHGARLLWRAPAFAIAAIATVALGIGASTAIFSVAYGVSLRPLPYPQPDRLIRIYESNPASGQLRSDVSEGAFDDWRNGAPSIESAALYGPAGTRFLAEAEREPLTGMAVSPAFFEVLGVRPLLGRTFERESQYTPQTMRDVVLSYGAWQRLFGGRPDILGTPLQFWRDDDLWTIVGVMPPGFAYGSQVDAWRPVLISGPFRVTRRSLRDDAVIARLRPGATIEQARAELELVAARAAKDFPAANAGWTVTVEPLHDAFVGNFGRATWLLLAAVGVVLLVACVNVAGLLLARMVARERETAVREALGAGPWRLLRLWLAEAGVLGALGAGLGVLLAAGGVLALKAAAPPGIPRLDAIAVDRPVLAVAVLATLLAIAIIAAAPLWSSSSLTSRRRSRGELGNGLRAGSAGGGDTRQRQTARHALMLAQCAGAVALAIVAVMLTRSFIKLASVDPGWDGERVLSLNLAREVPADLRRPWYLLAQWSDELIARLEATPGIDRAAVTSQVPLSPFQFRTTFARGRGASADDGARWTGTMHNVSDGYFDVMGIRLAAGRLFGPGDRFNEAQLSTIEPLPQGVVIVSEGLARALWPGQPAIGQGLWVPGVDLVVWREVVGVVEDVQFEAIGGNPEVHLFVPRAQARSGVARLLVKAGRDAGSIVDTVRRVAQEVSPGTRIDGIAPLETLVSRATAQPRFTMRTVATFGLVALVLAAIGIYGTLSYAVGARTREIAVRLSLGASRAAVLPEVLRRNLHPVAAGAVIGIAIAAALARTFEALLFQVEPLDAVSFAGGALLLAVAALAAALAPVRRVLNVDPAAALRSE